MKEQYHSRIPHSLNECTNTNETVSDLYHYASQLEKWGQRLLIIMIVMGILSSIGAAISLIDVYEELIIPALIVSLLSWSVFAVIEFIAYHVLAMLIRALASITENTMISANVALWQASRSTSHVIESQPAAPKAETLQDATTPAETVPAQEIPVSEEKVKENIIIRRDNNSWVCPMCEQKNLASRTSCWRCDYQI